MAQEQQSNCPVPPGLAPICSTQACSFAYVTTKGVNDEHLSVGKELPISGQGKMWFRPRRYFKKEDLMVRGGACSLSLLLRQHRALQKDMVPIRNACVSTVLQTLCPCYVPGNLPQDSVNRRLFSAKRRVNCTAETDATMTMILPQHKTLTQCTQSTSVHYSAAVAATGPRITKALAIVMGTEKGI